MSLLSDSTSSLEKSEDEQRGGLGGGLRFCLGRMVGLGGVQSAEVDLARSRLRGFTSSPLGLGASGGRFLSLCGTSSVAPSLTDVEVELVADSDAIEPVTMRFDNDRVFGGTSGTAIPVCIEG